MTSEDAANIDSAKGRAIAAYDEAQARLRAAREAVRRTREGPGGGRRGSRQAGFAIAEIEALGSARDALDAARQDLRKVGLRPENW